MRMIFVAGCVLAVSALGCGDGTSVDVDAGPMDAAAADSGGGDRDAAAGDTGTAVDSGSATDSGPPGDSGPPFDGGPLCEGLIRGACTATGVMCHCCPAGGPAERCLCTTECSADSECTDPARPRCNRPGGTPVPAGGAGGGPTGICTPTDFACAWGAVCASPDTLIATPTGDRAIATLLPGDLVYSLDHGFLRAVPIRGVTRTPVMGHRVVRVSLVSGAVIEMSEGHPTADGRFFGDLVPGESMDGVPIRSVELIPYLHDATYDVLPDSETGTYVAAGVLVGSTLAQ